MLDAMTTERARIIESLCQVFVQDATVRVAVLFGSAARDRLTAQSDADVGVVPVDAAALARELELGSGA
jgi:predicted nucleotidyltransferase